MEAIRLVQEDCDGEVVLPRLERARLLLERGAGYDVGGGGSGRRSAEGRAVAFANRVNALALAMTRWPQFKARCSRCSLAFDFGEFLIQFIKSQR
jgi:hypothetical protein